MGNSLIQKNRHHYHIKSQKNVEHVEQFSVRIKTIHVLYIQEPFQNFETRSGNMNQHNENSITIKLTVGI